jgi:hypothetical protein
MNIKISFEQWLYESERERKEKSEFFFELIAQNWRSTYRCEWTTVTFASRNKECRRGPRR